MHDITFDFEVFSFSETHRRCSKFKERLSYRYQVSLTNNDVIINAWQIFYKVIYNTILLVQLCGGSCSINIESLNDFQHCCVL